MEGSARLFSFLGRMIRKILTPYALKYNYLQFPKVESVESVVQMVGILPRLVAGQMAVK